jgi:hypothetical protein
MGEAGRRKAIEKFSWEKTIDILLGHFERVVHGRGKIGACG